MSYASKFYIGPLLILELVFAANGLFKVDIEFDQLENCDTVYGLLLIDVMLLIPTRGDFQLQ